jgi:hypothetical protein
MQMIVIGVDTHKRQHTLVALDAVTGAARGQLTIPATDEGTLDGLRFAGELDEERVWGRRGLPATCPPVSSAVWSRVAIGWLGSHRR